MIIAGATAYPRLIDFARFREIADEVGAWLMVDAAHFIGLVAGGAIPSPVPYADVVTFTTHKVLRGPRGGMIVCRPELAARIDKAVFPFLQGGPLMHAVAAKAVALGECLQPAYRDLRRAGGGQREGARRRARRRGDAPGLRRHRHPPRPARPAGHRRARPDRCRGGDALRRRADHAEQERHPLRPAEADGRLRHPGRHRRRHHAGHDRAGDEGGRRADRARGAGHRRVRLLPRWPRRSAPWSPTTRRTRRRRRRTTARARVPAHPGGGRDGDLPAHPRGPPDRAALGGDDRGPRPRRARHPHPAARRHRDARRFRGRHARRHPDAVPRARGSATASRRWRCCPARS